MRGNDRDWIELLEDGPKYVVGDRRRHESKEYLLRSARLNQGRGR